MKLCKSFQNGSRRGKTQHCMLEPKTRVRSSSDSYMMDEERKAFSVAASLLYFDVKRKNCNTRLLLLYFKHENSF